MSATKSSLPPFFPPGIANHKTISSSFNSKPTNNNKLFTKRSVRNVKNISKQSMSHTMSNSTPNLKSLDKINNNLLPKHNCDMGLSGNSTFKATPLPNYYSTESLKRNKSLWENCQQKYHTKSLDRINYNNTYQSNKNIKKSLVDFNPDKPFYPPSKYPNIHNPSGNLLRLLETREKYKTPLSRKGQHRTAKETYSPKHTNLSQFKSVPNLNDRKQFLHKTPNIPKKSASSKRLAAPNSSMTDSYFYPKPTVDEIFIEQNDRLAQSLMHESTLAEKIHSGTLERATNRKKEPPEITDFDDYSPSKSYNDPKRFNSLSIDSLDGQNHHKSKNYHQNKQGFNKDELDGNLNYQNSELSSTCSTDIVQNMPLETNDSLDTPDVIMNNQNAFPSKIDQFNNEPEKYFETSHKTEVNNEKNQFLSQKLSEEMTGRSYMDQYNSDKYLEHTKPAAVIVEPTKINMTQINPYTIVDNHRTINDSNKMEHNNHNDSKKNKYANLRKIGDNYMVDFAQSLAAVQPISTSNENRQNYNKYNKNGTVQKNAENDIDSSNSNRKDNNKNDGINYEGYNHNKLDQGYDKTDYDDNEDEDFDDSDGSEGGYDSVIEYSGDKPSGGSSSGYYGYMSAGCHGSSTSNQWISSPDLIASDRSHTIGHNQKLKRKKRYVKSENPLKPCCNRCLQPAYFNERISINNLIFHRGCFTCHKCHTHLSFKNCVIHKRKPFCEVHIYEKLWKSVRGTNSHTKPAVLPRPANMTYSGVQSLKQKLVTTTSKSAAPPTAPKQFTPPRETEPVIRESVPLERDPNVVVSDTSSEARVKEIEAQTAASDRLAKFREMEKILDSQNNPQPTDDRKKSKDAIPVDTKSLRDKFVNTNDSTDAETKRKPYKLNPAEEIQLLYKKEALLNKKKLDNEESQENAEKINDQDVSESTMSISRIRAKELKEKFANFSIEAAATQPSSKNKEFQLDLGEGGIFESKPKDRLEDIVAHEYEKKVDIPTNSVKSNLQRFKEIQQEKAKPYQKRNTEPIKLDLDLSRGGVYESTPSESAADSAAKVSSSYQDDFKDKTYANEAKKAFLEKQKQMFSSTDERSKKSPPKMINIWEDMCTYSGVFENEPTQQKADVVRAIALEKEQARIKAAAAAASQDSQDPTLNNVEQTNSQTPMKT